MSTVETNLVQPSTGTLLTLGASGDTVDIPAGATIDATGATITGWPAAVDNTPAFQAFLSASQTPADSTFVKVTCNGVRWDTDSAYDESTNYRFTVPADEAGKYYVYGQISYYSTHGGNDLTTLKTAIYKNGAAVFMQPQYLLYQLQGLTVYFGVGLTLAVGDYIELFGYFNNVQGGSYHRFLGDSVDQTYFGAYKMIGL